MMLNRNAFFLKGFLSTNNFCGVLKILNSTQNFDFAKLETLCKHIHQKLRSTSFELPPNFISSSNLPQPDLIYIKNMFKSH